MAEITNEDLLNNGEVMYELVITCTECEGAACIGMTNNLDEAKEKAVEAETMVMDDDNQLHNYISAVAEVSRRVVWTPPRDETE